MVTSGELTQLWRKHSAALLLLARGRCGGYATSIADDCVQEAFIRLAAADPTPDDPVAWLTTVVRNVAIDTLRSHKRRIARETHATKNKPNWLEPLDTSSLDAPSGDVVQHALEQLDDTTRDVVIAHIWNKMTFRQIAEAFQMSPATAHRTYTSGIEKLKSRMTNLQNIHNECGREENDLQQIDKTNSMEFETGKRNG